MLSYVITFSFGCGIGVVELGHRLVQMRILSREVVDGTINIYV